MSDLLELSAQYRERGALAGAVCIGSETGLPRAAAGAWRNLS